MVDSWKLKGCFDTVYSPTLCLFFSFFFFYRLLFTMHHLTVFVVCVTGIMLCMAGTSYSNTCNCHCSHTCNYGNSPDDSVKSPYGSKANPGFSCKDINANRRKQNAIYWIRLTGIIQKKITISKHSLHHPFSVCMKLNNRHSSWYNFMILFI